jgi:hypothetical protein
VEAIGWTEFFFVTTLTALPGLVLLRIMRREVKALEHGNVA